MCSYELETHLLLQFIGDSVVDLFLVCRKNFVLRTSKPLFEYRQLIVITVFYCSCNILLSTAEF